MVEVKQMEKTELEKKLKIEFHKYKIYLWNREIKNKEYLGIVMASNTPSAKIKAGKKFKIKFIQFIEVKAIRKNIKRLSINQDCLSKINKDNFKLKEVLKK